MRKVLSATAIGCCSLRLVEAGSFKWNANKARDDLDWTPARATPTAGYHQPASMLPNPEPTTPPVRRRRDTSDANSVCGYFSGIASAPYACASDSLCIFTTTDDDWVAGCCPTTSIDCIIQTTCVDSKVGESIISKSSTMDDYTWWCYEEDLPYCMTFTYDDMPGYSIMGCTASRTAAYDLIDHSTSSASAITTTPVTPKPSPPSDKVGPIVGGVVGGVAVLALLILGLIFLLRKKRKTGGESRQDTVPTPEMTYMNGAGAGGGVGDDNPHGTSPGQNGYQYQQLQPPPTMQQQHQSYPPDTFPDMSKQKPQYNVQTHAVYEPYGTSPPVSPLPHQMDAAPAYQQPTPIPQQQQQVQQQPTANIHEMPAARGDRELLELDS